MTAESQNEKITRKRKNIKRLFRWVILLFFLTLTIYYFYPEPSLPKGCKIHGFVVYKSRHEMEAYQYGKLVKTYKISLGKNPTGDKEFEGDGKTPEGEYQITSKNEKSSFYKNLGISYPGLDDIEYAKKAGKSAGGDIKIHGVRNGFGWIGKFQRWVDWTNGCIAVTNSEMDELFLATDTNTTIEINP